MTVKELKNILLRVNDNVRVCVRLENDDLNGLNEEIVSIAVEEGHFNNTMSNEEWGKYLYFTL